MARIRIGTSGWAYAHWRGPFYPPEVRKRDWLTHYAGQFDAAEINAAFYRVPKAETFRGWAQAVPADFAFTVKANRYITHMKKLKDPGDSVQRFLEPVRALGERLGPVLFQLPPNWGCDIERLRGFLAALPGGHRYAFEFRDPSWFAPAVFDALRDAGAALCIHQLEELEAPLEVTADFVYLRLHGPEAAYTGRYEEATLARWAARIDAWAAAGCDVYCFFDNDDAGNAPADAARLHAMTGDNRPAKG